MCMENINSRNVCLGLLREADDFYNSKGSFKIKRAKPVPVRGILFLREKTSDGLIGVDLINKGVSYPIGPNGKNNNAFVISRSYVNLEPLLSYLGFGDNLSDEAILRLQNFLLSREFFQKNEALFGRKSVYLGVFGYLKYGYPMMSKMFPLEIGDMIADIQSKFYPRGKALTLTKKEIKYSAKR